ncbi:MAG: response regulator transcription factor [Firmicutes bacterium]|nr:response regulator transcription factor [Bacillota bacterium]
MSSRDVNRPQGSARLTPRERDVLRLIARGRNNREIAGALFISEHTVKNHVSNIYRKLQAEDRTQAALMAIREGLVSVD